MQIDIRKDSVAPVTEITEIVFGDGGYVAEACKIVLRNKELRISSLYGEYVYLSSKEDALNLVKALEKAISLGTWD